MFENIKKLFEGRQIYKELRRKSNNYSIYISQHPAIGDAFVIGSYLKNYFTEGDILTYIGNASKKIYELYQFSNLIELSQNQTNALIKYLQFMEIAEDKVLILHYQAIEEHSGIAFRFNGIHGLSFSDLLEIMIFRGYGCDDRVYPIQKKYKNYDLVKKNNSVIFFPYANTLHVPSMLFWNPIIEKYVSEGKKVYTYIFGDEKAIQGTIPISCELEQIYGLVEYAGEIVGVRSGIMDLISQAQCKKTIYYPIFGAESWINGSIIDFWSLNKMGYKVECKEIEWK